ncbi:MAG: hypothetical protein ACYDCO_23535 [Armatimonadota bacterium]
MTKAEMHKIIDEMTPEQLKVVEDLFNSLPEPSPEPKKKRVSAMGKYAHLPGSTEEFMKRKQEEKELEERRWK